jgi:hypothetical protein
MSSLADASISDVPVGPRAPAVKRRARADSDDGDAQAGSPGFGSPVGGAGGAAAGAPPKRARGGVPAAAVLLLVLFVLVASAAFLSMRPLVTRDEHVHPHLLCQALLQPSASTWAHLDMHGDEGALRARRHPRWSDSCNACCALCAEASCAHAGSLARITGFSRKPPFRLLRAFSSLVRPPELRLDAQEQELAGGHGS